MQPAGPTGGPGAPGLLQQLQQPDADYWAPSPPLQLPPRRRPPYHLPPLPAATAAVGCLPLPTPSSATCNDCRSRQQQSLWLTVALRRYADYDINTRSKQHLNVGTIGHVDHGWVGVGVDRGMGEDWRRQLHGAVDNRLVCTATAWHVAARVGSRGRELGNGWMLGRRSIVTAATRSHGQPLTDCTHSPSSPQTARLPLQLLSPSKLFSHCFSSCLVLGVVVQALTTSHAGHAQKQRNTAAAHKGTAPRAPAYRRA